MKKTGIVTGLILLLMNSVPALAQLPHHDPILQSPEYYISKASSPKLISVEEKDISPEEAFLISSDESAAMPFQLQEGGSPLAIADIVFKVWDIIKDGKPLVSVQYKNANALPNIAGKKWEALTGWKKERSMVFAVSTTNLYGMTTVDLEYKVALIYGGSFKGKGQYIASARVVPTKVDVKWGYNLDVTVDVPSIVNIASSADPLAAINLDVTYKISTVLRSYSEANTYEVQGNGIMKADGKVVYSANSR